MATIGYRSAVADAFHLKVTGVIAYIMWAGVHVWYLIGWGNRIGTIYQWFRNLVFTKNRNHRIITFGRGLQDYGPRGVAASRTRSIMPAATRLQDMERPLAPPPILPTAKP